MKALSIICYIIGSILIIVSCFTSSVAATWWTGGLSILFLAGGCIFQYIDKTRRDKAFHNNSHATR